MKKLRALVVVLAVMALTAAGTAFVLGRTTNHVAAKTVAAAQSGARQDGVKVHGHWTVDVRNPDGSLASHNEFENALVAGHGNVALAQLLARMHSVTSWRIVTTSLDGLQCTYGSYLDRCEIFEPSIPGGNLTVSSPTTVENFGKLVLNGHFTAGNDGSLHDVTTYIEMCPPTYTPGQDCIGETRGSDVTEPFTSKTLDPVVSVANGQQVQITVVISFS